jgi:exopolysaccharide production protein ExoZ
VFSPPVFYFDKKGEILNTSNLPNKLFTVQALRALAASGVVVFHVLEMLVHKAGYSFAVSGSGAAGVDLFFVISGFIMVYTSYNSFSEPNASLSFIRRRAIRIVPIYWFYTSVVVFLLAFAPRLFSGINFNLQNVISSYLFILTKRPDGSFGALLQQGWTLCFEVYFYLVFAMLLNLPRKYFLVISAGVFTAGIILGTITKLAPWAMVATHPVLLEFYFGSVIAFLFIKGYHLPRPWAAAAVILSIAIIVITRDGDIRWKWTNVIFSGLSSGALLLGAISLEYAGMKVLRLFSALGDSSYSLYLVHTFVISVVGKIWVMLHLSGRMSPAVLFLVAFGCSVAAGHVLYLLIEKPITLWLSRTWKSRPVLA